VTSAGAARGAGELSLRFHDGRVPARVLGTDEEPSETPARARER
jgi:hypothetical protein